MKVLLLSIGSRGDSEPYLGIGEVLRSKGAEVTCAFPEQHREFAIQNGFAFESLGEEFLGMLETPEAKTSLDGKGIKKVAALVKLSKTSIPIQMDLLDRQYTVLEKIQPDIIVHNSKSMLAIPWSIKNKKRSVLFALQPALLHEVRGLTHVGFPPKFPVSLSYRIMKFATTQTTMSAVRRKFKGEFSAREIGDAIMSEPVMYNVSPSLFAQPDYWSDTCRVIGFWERDKTLYWSAPKELTDFIDSHEKILFLTFGSMTNGDPTRNTSLFMDVLSECKIPAIINISGGGLRELANYDKKNYMFISSAPYDWLLPKMHATIHHGGAGTTHSSLKAGCATMAVPHSVDQPMWSLLIHSIGAGPVGIPIAKLNKNDLKAKILDLMNNKAYKAVALRVAKNMLNENSADELYQFIAQGL